MSSIAAMVGHTTAATTGMVDKLDELGYTLRVQAISDRRRVLVQITQAGRDLVTLMGGNLANDIAETMVQDDAQLIMSNVNSRIEKTYKQAKATHLPVKKTI